MLSNGLALDITKFCTSVFSDLDFLDLFKESSLYALGAG